jgi:hypothetical protein
VWVSQVNDRGCHPQKKFLDFYLSTSTPEFLSSSGASPTFMKVKTGLAIDPDNYHLQKLAQRFGMEQ